MRSMTGFGRGEASNADGTLAFRVEISSVNRKQFELKFNLPRDMVSKLVYSGEIQALGKLMHDVVMNVKVSG